MRRAGTSICARFGVAARAMARADPQIPRVAVIRGQIRGRSVSRAAHELGDALQVVRRAELHDDAALAPAHLHPDRVSEARFRSINAAG